MPNYKTTDSNQYQWFELCLAEFYSASHPINQFLSLLKRLDWSKFDMSYKNHSGKGGSSAYPPDRVVAVLIWHFLYGNRSMRQLERDLERRVDLIFLSGGLRMDHSTLSRFRTRHKEALDDLFNQTVFLGVLSGLIDFETVCIDGTKLKAYAGKSGFHKQADLERLHKEVQKSCQKRFEELESCNEEVEKRLIEKKVNQLKTREAKIEHGLQFLKTHTDRDSVHLTDPDCRWQKDKDRGFIPGYNGQIAVDSKSQMIVSQQLVSDNTDTNQGMAMIQKTESQKETFKDLQTPGKMHHLTKTHYVMDSGYYSESNLEAMSEYDVYMPDINLAHQMKTRKTTDQKSLDTELPNQSSSDTSYKEMKYKYHADGDYFTCPKGKRLNFYRTFQLNNRSYRGYRRSGCAKCVLNEHCTTQKSRKEIAVRADILTLPSEVTYHRSSKKSGLHNVQGKYTKAMREKLETDAGKKIYKMRQWVVEGVFAVMNAIRNGDELFRRGIDRSSTEWTEQCITHNIGKLLHYRVT